MGKCRLIIYSPAYNAASSVPELFSRVRQAAAGLAKKGITIDQFIMMEDGSTDGTAALLDAEARKTPFLRVVHKKNNEGVVTALLDGMHSALRAAGDEDAILIRMDADLEHQPEDLERVIGPLVAGKARISVGYIEYDNRNGLIFRLFNELAGKAEGRAFAGVAMPQFCPGFHAVRAGLLRKLLPRLEAEMAGFRHKTKKDMVTMDVALLALARKSGEKMAAVKLSPIEDRWIKKPPLGKILRYLWYHFDTMGFLQRYRSSS
ncbi:MAG: glycosyltransferase family 2 protein [Candidatus ainarchaeum sp.]|nr:glycosyltransferase family 2 protein [Candidatus ainarchaeum sp.]